MSSCTRELQALTLGHQHCHSAQHPRTESTHRTSEGFAFQASRRGPVMAKGAFRSLAASDLWAVDRWGGRSVNRRFSRTVGTLRRHRGYGFVARCSRFEYGRLGMKAGSTGGESARLARPRIGRIRFVPARVGMRGRPLRQPGWGPKRMSQAFP